MKQFYLKFYTLLLCLVIGGGNSWAQQEQSETLAFSSSSNSVTITYGGAGEPGGDVEVSQGIVTVTSAGGQAKSATALQIYKTKSMTVSVPTAYIITKVEFTYPSSCYPFAEAIPDGMKNATTKTASGATATYKPSTSVSSITFNNIAGGQTKVNKMTVSYKASGAANVNVTGVTLNKSTASINVGEKSTLVASVSPDNATNKAVTWSSSNNSVATVSNSGEVTGVAKGKATITAKTTDGNYTASCEVTVSAIDVTEVTLDKASEELQVGETLNLIATVLPANATNKNVTWSTSNDEVATVSNGVVTGVSEGTATITVTTDDGNYKATCAVTVTKAEELDEYLFLFAPNGSDSDSSTAWTKTSSLNNVFAEGYQYISSITATNNVYPARNTLVNGVKFGTSSKAGSISFTLKNPVKATYIVVSAAHYSDTEGQTGFTINGQKVEMPAGQNKVYCEYAIKLDGSDLSTITLAQSKASSGRIYVESIKLITGDTYYASCSRKLTAQKSGAYYATFSSDKVTFFPKDYIVSAVGVEDGQLYQFDNEEAFDEDNVEINGEDVIGYYVPANTGVLVTSLENTVNYYTVDVDGVTPSNDAEAVNMLRPASASMTGDYKFYKLAYDDYDAKTGLGFYWGANNGAAFTCKAGTAYLAVPPSALAVPTDPAVKSFVFADDATAIKSVAVPTVDANAPVYNMAGQRVSANTKGIVFQNGKKYFNK